MDVEIILLQSQVDSLEIEVAELQLLVQKLVKDIMALSEDSFCSLTTR